MEPDSSWLDWTTRLQAIAQNGLTFARDEYDIERYQAVRQIASEMIAAGSGQTSEEILAILAKETDYATPKVDVRGVVFQENKLLLVRERSDGKWTLPGGWADVCESPAENVVREIYEESGFSTCAEKILAVFDRGKHPHEPAFAFHVYKIFMRCVITGGKERVSSETDSVNFFSETEIPEYPPREFPRHKSIGCSNTTAFPACPPISITTAATPANYERKFAERNRRLKGSALRRCTTK